jgi:hypothetical protein
MSNRNWIGDNPIDLESNEKFVFLAKTVRSLNVGHIPKGSLVIHRYKDNTIKVRPQQQGLYSIWIYVDITPSDIKEIEWKRIK